MSRRCRGRSRSPIDADRVLIDEREGRATAARYDVPVTGVAAILLRASSRGAIDLEAELDARCQ